MNTRELLAALQQDITPDEARALQVGEGLVIGQGNRDAMLELLACDPAGIPDDPVDEAAIDQLRSITTDYLAQYMADQPSGWKWIIMACIFRTFVLRLPMHPESAVHYTTATEDGRTVYCCPAKVTDGVTNCSFCVARAGAPTSGSGCPSCS